MVHSLSLHLANKRTSSGTPPPQRASSASKPRQDCLGSTGTSNEDGRNERPCTLASITATAGWSIQQRPCSLASITTAAGRSTHCPGTLAFITAAAGWSTQRCPWTLALIIDIAAVS
ncbi:hypothetical protein ACOMHN_032042 [Nucella lapillus]